MRRNLSSTARRFPQTGHFTMINLVVFSHKHLEYPRYNDTTIV
ncbi:hypothetical protein [Rhodopirellula sallentina]|nr:hypothetical protein [Rhodopirellula sallentina]